MEIARPTFLPHKAPKAFTQAPLEYLSHLTKAPSGEASLAHTIAYAGKDSPAWHHQLKHAWIDGITTGRITSPLVDEMRTMAHSVLVPRPDNFTPPERTPWGGMLIPEIKASLGVTSGIVVGESWEISGHPSFPNIIPLEYAGFQLDIPLWLVGKIAPQELYGPANVAKFGDNPPFLTKLLNSSSTHNLSIQIHPDADYAAKNDAWHSKTEMWVILGTEAGAGIYIGLKEGVTEQQMQTALNEERDASDFLNFVEVEPGDIFFIPAGTPHAIGAGVLLLEQQETSETTFRYFSWWDGRELHVDDAVQSTHWNDERGMAFVDTVIRRTPRVLVEGDAATARHELLAAEDEFSYDRVIFSGGDSHAGNATQGMHGLTVTEGSVTLQSADGHALGTFGTGQSFIVPAALGKYELKAPDGNAVVYVGRSDPR